MKPPERASTGGPHVVVLSSLFPSSTQPGAGLFVRERMFRVGRRMPLCVGSPRPWFPLQALARRLRPGFRPDAPAFERQQDVDVWFPRFFSMPGVLKRLDGWLIEADAPDGWTWRSSLTREDSGDGACEVIYVCSLRVIR